MPPVVVRRQGRGIVLVAVLWIVAALSIFVAGFSRSAREEARIATSQREAVQGQALGNAAIQLVLQSINARRTPPSALERTVVNYQGTAIEVEVMPLSGLIDLNAAPVPVLANLYRLIGGLPEGAAQALAQATNEVRSHKDGSAVAGFEAPEELLQLPGFTYEAYARLAPFVTADLRGSGRVNPLAAPVEVLAVLAGGDSAAAARIAAARQAAGQNPGTVDTTALDPSAIATTAARRARLNARVPLASGAWQVISMSVEFSARQTDGTPWHVFNVHQAYEPAARSSAF